MRLINVETKALEEFFGDSIPPYAILSHCWGKDEVTFQDFNAPGFNYKLGCEKINYATLQTTKDNLEYLWVDTCCIDKTSSAELSEAINSMYQWYAKSKVCYAYLEDVQDARSNTYGQEKTFERSKWFTRGWTLQELIAPNKVKFFGQQWMYLGSRKDLSDTISNITKIPHNILAIFDEIRSQSVARRMSWASKRETTRVEDKAYCLLGIFGINMPLLYGEGDRAFQRLQEELIKASDDQTIFAWHTTKTHEHYGIFAQSPADFGESSELVPIPMELRATGIENLPYTMTNRGLHIELPLIPTARGVHIGVLNCQYALDFSGPVGIPLYRTENSSSFVRFSTQPRVCSNAAIKMAERRKIYIEKNPLFLLRDPTRRICRLNFDQLTRYGYKLTNVTPSNYPYNWATSTMALALGPDAKIYEAQHTLRAAFEFQNDRVDIQTDLVVAVTIITNLRHDDEATALAAFYHKEKKIPLSQWYQEFKQGQVGEGYSNIKYPATKPGLGALNDEVEVRIDVSPVKMLNQNIFSIDLTSMVSDMSFSP